MSDTFVRRRILLVEDDEVVGRDTAFFRHTRSHFLQKPCSPGALVQTVRQCLDEK